jgi:hypothetical protein
VLSHWSWSLSTCPYFDRSLVRRKLAWLELLDWSGINALLWKIVTKERVMRKILIITAYCITVEWCHTYNDTCVITPIITHTRLFAMFRPIAEVLIIALHVRWTRRFRTLWGKSWSNEISAVCGMSSADLSTNYFSRRCSMLCAGAHSSNVGDALHAVAVSISLRRIWRASTYSAKVRLPGSLITTNHERQTRDKSDVRRLLAHYVTAHQAHPSPPQPIPFTRMLERVRWSISSDSCWMAVKY